MKQETGVPSELYSTYDFSDLAWANPADPSYDIALVYLATKCAVVAMPKNTFYVLDRHSGFWVPTATQKLTANTLAAQYCGQFTHTGMTGFIVRDKIMQFLNAAICPLSGTIAMPLCGDFVIYRSEKFLNTWKNTIIAPGDLGDGNDITHFLNLVRGALCNKPDDLNLQELMAILKGNNSEEVEFRFLMHWLAAIYQRPGINLQTNVLLLGSSTGIGKGTLMRLIRMVFNTGFSKYSEGDLQRDWNDFLEGVLVLEADEFKGQKKIDFSNMLKRDSTNNLITINKRGCSPRDIPNTANWIMTSNDEHPLIIEEMDRRNMFIHTSIDVDKWRPYSLDLNRRLDTDKSYAKALPGAFAAVLALIPVDYQLLSIAPHTALRAINRKASQNALEQWLYEADDGDLFGFERDTWLEAGLLFQRFEYYREKFARSSKLNSIAAWGREMSALARADRIKKDDRKGYKPRYFIPSKNYPLLLEEDGSYAEDPIVTRMNEWKKTRK